MEFHVYDAAMHYCNYCTGITALSTIFALSFFWICRTRQVNIYRRYILAYILSNLIDAIVYNVTYVNTFGWGNSLILFADGYFAGPRAIGIQMIACTTPAAILGLLNLYRYAQVTNFTRFEFLSSSFSVIYCSFWLSLNALFHYSVITILFQTDGDAIDQTADLFHWILEKGRDYGFEQCIGTYWMNGTFRNGKWKPITGLGVLYFSYISSVLVNAYISYKIRRTERSRFLKSSIAARYEPRHNLLIWSQMAIVSVTVSLPRLIIALIPFIHESHRGESDAYVAYFAMFSVPLRPILSNLTVILVVRDIRKHVLSCMRRRRSQSNAVQISVDSILH